MTCSMLSAIIVSTNVPTNIGNFGIFSASNGLCSVLIVRACGDHGRTACHEPRLPGNCQDTVIPRPGVDSRVGGCYAWPMMRFLGPSVALVLHLLLPQAARAGAPIPLCSAASPRGETCFLRIDEIRPTQFAA